MGPSFHIENFGCRAARADGEAIASLLRAAGAKENQAAQAGLVVVNTCSVTIEADRAARAFIRRAHRLNPAARIIVTGCYAQRAPEELTDLPGVTAVIGNSHKALAPDIALALAQAQRPDHDYARETLASSSQFVSIPALLAASGNRPLVLSDEKFGHSFLEEAPIIVGAQTRPNLKIQEGCSNRCSFCVIPQTRGSSRSLPGETILKRIRSFVQSGGNELVLSGINLGRWGRDLNAPQLSIGTLSALLRAIFEQTSLPRLRLSSIEPMDWDADLIGLMRDFGGTRLARHAHLPLQCGSDRVLRRMHRRYRPWHYAEKVEALLGAAGSPLTLGADVMVGFPGETDREFQESHDFIASLPFGYLHLFRFSPRPGTRAWALHQEDPVSPVLIDERMAAMRALADLKMRAHRRRFVGTVLEAITLNTPQPTAAAGRTAALTENFLPVAFTGVLSANQLLRIRIQDLEGDNTLIASLPAAPWENIPIIRSALAAEPLLEIPV